MEGAGLTRCHCCEEREEKKRREAKAPFVLRKGLSTADLPELLILLITASDRLIPQWEAVSERLAGD